MYRDELFENLAMHRCEVLDSRRICNKLHSVRVSESSHCSRTQAACIPGLPNMTTYYFLEFGAEFETTNEERNRVTNSLDERNRCEGSEICTFTL